MCRTSLINLFLPTVVSERWGVFAALPMAHIDCWRSPSTEEQGVPAAQSPQGGQTHFVNWWLTHWGRVTHICVSDLTSIGSDNGLSPGRRQAIIRTNAWILLIRPLGTNFSEFLVAILIFSFKKMRLKVSSAKRRPFCLGLNELTHYSLATPYWWVSARKT